MLTIFAKLALPAVVTNTLFLASIFITLIFVGWLGDPVFFAVVGLQGTVNAIMCLSLMIGLNTGVETFTS